MKPWKIILSIVLLLFSIIRLASTCNKHKKAAIKKEFSKRLNKIESARTGIFSYQSSGNDSMPVSRENARLYNRVVDSCIDYYRTNYFSDEKRYKQYLKVLYEYKKLSYEYQNLVKLYADPKLTAEKKSNRDREIQQRIRTISFDLDRDRLAAMWEIYDR